ncbi:hypothetical protein Y032_0936g3113 [Ancylostoma ceylanicum]|uniref:BPTI/Kunitz inhibitor domain-containing protein n=1 Tax=Ancylostoma ceylanicum TaxID=53326 RepID=A0A016W8Z9_9BILA|nr:hypothetical protein Y032_0936g3113 [Ancylostoma ceylanicum]
MQRPRSGATCIIEITLVNSLTHLKLPAINTGANTSTLGNFNYEFRPWSLVNDLEFYSVHFRKLTGKEIQKVFISGDNDVGGEAEPVQSHLTTRFSHLFANSFPDSHKLFDRLSLSEVNLMNGEVTNILDSSFAPKLNLILSHVPFAFPSYHDSGNFITTLEPDLILSAHDHKAYIHHLPRSNGAAINSTEFTAVFKPKLFTVGGDEPILELQTPTCSYRMGVYDVGYGFARIEYSGENEKFTVSFSVLWLASRFYALILYATLLGVGLVVRVPFKTMQLRVLFLLCFTIAMVAKVIGANDRWAPNCTDPISHGGGNKYLLRYAYNSTAGECDTFYWDGQHRNGNNFKDLYECILTCYPVTGKWGKLPNVFP